MVEAALVLPVLALFFAGIVDFGFALNDLQNVNNATFRAARQLAVDDYPDTSACVADPATATDTENITCLLRIFSDRPVAETYVKVEAPATMTAGEEVLLCLATPARSVTGIGSQFAGDVMLHSNRHVRIESDNVDVVDYADALPAGHDWAWCN